MRQQLTTTRRRRRRIAAQTRRTPSPPRTIRERRRLRRRPNKVQLRMGMRHSDTPSNLLTALPQGLIKSSTRPDQQYGVQLLSDIFKTTPERRRECLYYLALGNYKLGNYAEARRYNELLLEKEPGNLQSQSLGGLIDDKVSKEGMYGLAIAGGVAVAAGVLGGMLMRSARAKR